MTARSPEMDAFVEEARAISIEAAFERCGFSLSTLRRASHEYVGPCPRCGGKDRFQLNPSKNVFLCRQGGAGGDGIALVEYLTGESFLDACETLLGRDRPGPAKSAEELRDSAARRREAEARNAAARAESEERAARQADESAHYRRRELERCLDIWAEGRPFPGSQAERYLALRGLDPSRIDPAFLRCAADLPFWGRDAGGRNAQLHRGPAMLALFVRPDGGSAKIIGIHQTWIDLDVPGKGRPTITDPQNAGETLPSKKMRGSKAGGLIPLVGRLSSARRMVAGEGIETVLGFGQREGFPEGTFYCAAGDLGNLCGKATKDSRIRHPQKVNIGKGGRRLPVFVPGEAPDLDSVAMPVPDHVDELVLLGDGDSDAVMTRAAMKRGARRHARDGRTVRVEMAPAGMDFAEMAQGVAA
ncbi:DUF7146 domain-containing protein [Aureimonas mangrovi]|uniref:DUF7146 domain-containing protein n=1 Tax=Aureimonas mangrovi TaxID=2758041 RepID=UPI00163DAD09|nr:CHC2 zinc finger domain-containing protein [Aureimonas mangrovi]